MSQDEEEEIPVTEREMNLKVIYVYYDNDAETSYSDGYLLENDESESSRLIIFFQLQGLTSNWDLDMFREAQARASKV